MESKKKPSIHLNYPQIFLIGFGFLASSLAWSVYNAQVPLILRDRFLLTSTAIGTIMTIDNFFGVIFQPLIGAWSDNTRTRIGRRLPWIAFGMPVCLILFALIPLQKVLWAFMGVIIAFNLVMALWRSPVISLMPDSTPSPLRSKANGIINLMGGLGSIIAFLVGGYLSDLREDKFYAFAMVSVVMATSLLILIIFVREPDALNYRLENNLPIPDNLAYQWAKEAREQFKLLWVQEGRTFEEGQALEAAKDHHRPHPLIGFRSLTKEYQRSLIAILIAIFAWFLGFNAIETFFTLYATSTYAVTDGQATMMLTGFSLAFLVFAVPAGILAQKIGRKQTILIGLVGIILIFFPILFKPNQVMVQILLIVGGGFWACININSLPMVLEFASEKTIGSFTGYYYLFSFTAAIVSPILYGMIEDTLQTNSLLFAFALVCFTIALISMLFAKHGDTDA